LRSGQSPHEVAASIGISSAEYYDLEGFDDLENAIDLGKIKDLASVLEIRPAALFSEEIPDEKIGPTELASRLEKLMRDQKTDLPQAENIIGWTLGPFVQEPESAILAWNVTCLQDVCRALNCDWLAVLNGIEAQERPSRSGQAANLPLW